MKFEKSIRKGVEDVCVIVQGNEIEFFVNWFCSFSFCFCWCWRIAFSNFDRKWGDAWRVKRNSFEYIERRYRIRSIIYDIKCILILRFDEVESGRKLMNNGMINNAKRIPIK